MIQMIRIFGMSIICQVNKRKGVAPAVDVSVGANNYSPKNTRPKTNRAGRIIIRPYDGIRAGIIVYFSPNEMQRFLKECFLGRTPSMNSEYEEIQFNRLGINLAPQE